MDRQTKKHNVGTPHITLKGVKKGVEWAATIPVIGKGDTSKLAKKMNGVSGDYETAVYVSKDAVLKALQELGVNAPVEPKIEGP